MARTLGFRRYTGLQQFHELHNRSYPAWAVVCEMLTLLRQLQDVPGLTARQAAMMDDVRELRLRERVGRAIEDGDRRARGEDIDMDMDMDTDTGAADGDAGDLDGDAVGKAGGSKPRQRRRAGTASVAAAEATEGIAALAAAAVPSHVRNKAVEVSFKIFLRELATIPQHPASAADPPRPPGQRPFTLQEQLSRAQDRVENRSDTNAAVQMRLCTDAARVNFDRPPQGSIYPDGGAAPLAAKKSKRAMKKARHQLNQVLKRIAHANEVT